MLICFSRYGHSNSTKMSILHYHELVGIIEEHEGKNYLVVDYYMPTKLLDMIKHIIGIEKFDESKILIDTDDKLPDEITVAILITCVIKDVDHFIHK